MANPIICSIDVGIKNLSYCILGYKEGSYNIYDWKVINLVSDESGSSYKFTPFDMNCRLINCLDEIDFSMCAHFLIEQQPSKNPKMKNLSIMLHSYFVMRYIIDKKINAKVSFIHAKKKLSIYDGPEIPCSLKGKYSRNKFYGIKYCSYIIRELTEWLDYFNGCKKKDDLADSFLQGAWFLMNKI